MVEWLPSKSFKWPSSVRWYFCNFAYVTTPPRNKSNHQIFGTILSNAIHLFTYCFSIKHTNTHNMVYQSVYNKLVQQGFNFQYEWQSFVYFNEIRWCECFKVYYVWSVFEKREKRLSDQHFNLSQNRFCVKCRYLQFYLLIFFFHFKILYSFRLCVTRRCT